MENVPQQVPKKTNPVLWIVLGLVAFIAASAFIYYWQTTNTNVVANTNVIQNTNTVQAARPIITKTTSPQNGWTIFGSTELPFEISFPANWYFTEPKSDHPDYVSFLIIASNEDASGILELKSESEGLVTNVFAERYAGSVGDYVNTVRVTPSDLPANRVKTEDVTVNATTFTKRIIDSTNLPDWEGTFSVEYYTKINDVIVRVLFLGRTERAASENQSIIDTILRTIK